MADRIKLGISACLRGHNVRYDGGLVPLIVPVTLLRHYARKYREPCLATQYYLDPHPLEFMLRNHV